MSTQTLERPVLREGGGGSDRPTAWEHGGQPERSEPTSRSGVRGILYFAQRAFSMLPDKAPNYMSEHGGYAEKRNELGVVAFANSIESPEVLAVQAATAILLLDAEQG